MARIDGIRLKIERAKKHIRDLDSEIRVFIESKPYAIGTKPHPVAQIKHTALFVASVKAVPDSISLMVGDAVHNLRSSLDHLVWQLVEAGGGTPNRDTYFPICRGTQGAQQYASAIGRGEIQKMRPGAEKVLSAVQPYITGDDTLWIIHELDRIDKHRLLLTVASSMDKWGVDVLKGQTMWFNEDRFFPLVPGYEIVNIPTSTYNAQPHEDFKLGIDVAFGKPEIVEGNLVLFTLNQMVNFIDALVGKFEGFLV